MNLKDHPDDLRIQQILSNPGTMATVLHSIFYRQFGEEMYGWTSDTLDMEAEETFGVQVPQQNLDKLEALIASIHSASFYTDWSAFTAVCQVLNGSSDPFDLSDPMLVAEMAWGVTEVLLNDSATPQWGVEVKRYAGLILHEEGFVRPPGVLRFADMPEQYQGSDSPADMHQQEIADTAHKAVVDEYLQEQSVLLFKQLSLLPWITREDLDKLLVELRA